MAASDLKPEGKTNQDTDNAKDKVVPIDSLKSAINSDEVYTPPTLKQEICPRDEKGRFVKGFSGNPHAWATRKLNTQLSLLCRENVEGNIDTLQSIIQNEKVDPVVRVAAIKLSFEYGYGKPLQGLDVYNSEHRDYQSFITHLAREVHAEFDSDKIDGIKDVDRIKNFIAKTAEDGAFLSKIYDDVLQHIGSDYSFQSYLRGLKERGGYYKFHK